MKGQVFLSFPHSFNTLSTNTRLIKFYYYINTSEIPGDLSRVNLISSHMKIKDVRAHRYCASLVRTLYMTWRLPRHVFQARAPNRNSAKYRADDLCGNLICEYFCWMLGDPQFFFGRSLPFLILSIILKNKKICRWEVLIISHTLFK